jgi:hypothetical protein
MLLNCLFSGGSVFAQDKTVTGKISAPDGGGIQGVTVQEKGTNSLTSDAEGNYMLRIKGQKPVLIFSFVGNATQEARPADGPLNISLAPGGNQLNEVVVRSCGR